MAISEKQLETWSHIGAVKASKDTYAIIRGELEDAEAPYAKRDFKIFLQGSYGNDTNIYADSDVDVIIRLDSVYYYDLSKLSDEEKALYEAARTAGGTSFVTFKGEVVKQLEDQFPGKVEPGDKAIFVQGYGARRDADVLACVQHRKYTRYKSPSDYAYVEGICFWNSAGQKIVNYPKQHSDNTTTKHQATGQYFKPMVRILKNMRNRMVEDGYLEEGVAPSYFLEGMLYNVPDDKFGTSYVDTFVASINWLINTDREYLECANEQYFLLHPSSLVTWRAEKMQTYLDAVVKYWDDR